MDLSILTLILSICTLAIVVYIFLKLRDQKTIESGKSENLENKIDAPFSYSLLAIILAVLLYASNYDTSSKWRQRYKQTFKVVLSTAIISFFSKAGLFIFPAFAACIVWLSEYYF